MDEKTHICVFCGNVATKAVEITTSAYDKSIWNRDYYSKGPHNETITFCNLGCVKSILLGEENCDNRAVEQAIKVVKALKAIDLKAEAAEEYREQLLKEAAKYVALI